MAKAKFDLSISFDKAEYLNPQLYMMADTLKDNIPEGSILHIITNRSKNDKVLKYISNNIPTKIYKKQPFKDLKSRCRYMFHCFDVDTDKDWLMKIEADLLFLKPLEEFNNILKDEYDLVIEPENRKIFPDKIAYRLWRNIYRELRIPMPMDIIEFRENKEKGYALYGTGLVCVKSKHLNLINNKWIPLIKKCEKWINFNIHPNEFAFTALSFKEKWNTYLYKDHFKFNPIGHFRKGDFPSVELIEDCKLPDDTVIFDYHRPAWLMHVAKYNDNIKEIVKKNKKHIPEDWWNLTSDFFQEGK